MKPFSSIHKVYTKYNSVVQTNKVLDANNRFGSRRYNLQGSVVLLRIFKNNLQNSQEWKILAIKFKQIITIAIQVHSSFKTKFFMFFVSTRWQNSIKLLPVSACLVVCHILLEILKRLNYRLEIQHAYYL